MFTLSFKVEFCWPFFFGLCLIHFFVCWVFVKFLWIIVSVRRKNRKNNFLLLKLNFFKKSPTTPTFFFCFFGRDHSISEIGLINQYTSLTSNLSWNTTWWNRYFPTKTVNNHPIVEYNRINQLASFCFTKQKTTSYEMPKSWDYQTFWEGLMVIVGTLFHYFSLGRISIKYCCNRTYEFRGGKVCDIVYSIKFRVAQQSQSSKRRMV